MDHQSGIRPITVACHLLIITIHGNRSLLGPSITDMAPIYLHREVTSEAVSQETGILRAREIGVEIPASATNAVVIVVTAADGITIENRLAVGNENHRPDIGTVIGVAAVTKVGEIVHEETTQVGIGIEMIVVVTGMVNIIAHVYLLSLTIFRYFYSP